jgi:hypothetical protein
VKIVDYIVGGLASGVIILLFMVILGDYVVALQTDRALDPEIITLMKMSITGIIGIISGYLGGKQSTKDSKDE